MGTSTSHRSPSTPEWEQVRELYQQPNPSPGEIAARVTAALDAETRAGLSDQTVTTSLDSLLEAATTASHDGLERLLENLGVGGEPVALQVASGLRREADTRIARAGIASIFGEMGVAALTSSALDACGGAMEAASLGFDQVEANLGAWEKDNRMGALTLNFLGREMEQAYRYFVSRDLGDFVGSDSLPLLTDRNNLVAGVGSYCFDTTNSIWVPELDSRILNVMEVGVEQRVVQLQPLFAQAVEAGLSALAAGG